MTSEVNQSLLAQGYIDLANLAITKGKVTSARVDLAQKYYDRALACFERASPDEDLPVRLALLQEDIDQAVKAVALRMPAIEPSLDSNVSPVEISKAAPALINRPSGVRNCWANSLLQMIANAPALTHAILQSSREEIQPVANLLRIYAQKQGSADPVPAAVGQAFRDASPTTSSSFSDTEDPKDVLERIVKLLGSNFDFEQEFTMTHDGSRITDQFSLIRNDDLKDFQPVGCVIQTNSEPGAEHFAALEKKPDGWVLVDDDKRQSIPADIAKEMLQQPNAYLFHYQKVEAIPAASVAPVIRAVESPVSWKMWLLRGAITMTASSCRFLWRNFVGGINAFTSKPKQS